MEVGGVSQMRRPIRNLLIALIAVFPVVFTVTSYLEDLAESSGQEGSYVIINMITGLPTRILNLASGAGYSGIFLLMLLESAAFPVPSEIILPLAGYLVFMGVLQYWIVIFCSTVAALVGSFVDYYLGRRLGEPLMEGKIKLPYVKPALLGKAQTWFSAHGPAAVALLRLVPTARVLISFPAGACRMSPTRFAFYTLLGCLPMEHSSRVPGMVARILMGKRRLILQIHQPVRISGDDYTILLGCVASRTRQAQAKERRPSQFSDRGNSWN